MGATHQPGGIAQSVERCSVSGHHGHHRSKVRFLLPPQIMTHFKPKQKYKKFKIEPEYLVVDLFCGFGGTTLGYEMTKGKFKVIACVNHDPKAIKSHWLNHKDVIHFEEDIRLLDLTGLIHVVEHYRKLYPNAKLILWASLECTNFSKAKGGLPRNADSRTLAEHLYRYIHALDPDYIKIENVVEFMSWGPLDENGKPISKKNGSDWMRWRNEVCSFGYRDDWKEMNSANYGAYTSRNRLFGCFAKQGLPIVWPAPTHAKKVDHTNLFTNRLKPWKPVREVLHLDQEGQSIFDRKIPLVEKTLERIYAGLLKFVAGGEKAFIAKYYSGRPKGKVTSIENPAGVISTFGNQTLVSTNFIAKYFTGDPEDMVMDIERPAGTVKPKDNHSLVSANFLMKYNSNQANGEPSKGHSLDEPSPVISTQGRLALVKSEFLVNYQHSSVANSIDEPSPTLTTKDKYSLCGPVFLSIFNGNKATAMGSIDNPCKVIGTKDRFALVQCSQFILREYKSATNSSIDEPAGTLPTVPKINLVSTEPFIMNTNFDNGPGDINQPLGTITANRKHHYIVNPSYWGHTYSIDEPGPTIIARQDKSPLYIVDTTCGDLIGIEINESDSPCMLKIKEFMLIYGIVDIKMRMLMVPELLKIQGFPEDYKMEGNQTDAKKFIGNSVVPHIVHAWGMEFINNAA